MWVDAFLERLSCCLISLLWCWRAEQRRRKKLTTGHFHVTYHGTLSEQSRWARQSTTRSRSFEPNFICFIISDCLYSSGQMRGWWSMHLNHSKEKEGQPEWQISLVSFKWRHLCFTKSIQIWNWMKREREKLWLTTRTSSHATLVRRR